MKPIYGAKILTNGKVQERTQLNTSRDIRRLLHTSMSLKTNHASSNMVVMHESTQSDNRTNTLLFFHGAIGDVTITYTPGSCRKWFCTGMVCDTAELTDRWIYASICGGRTDAAHQEGVPHALLSYPLIQKNEKSPPGTPRACSACCLCTLHFAPHRHRGWYQAPHRPRATQNKSISSMTGGCLYLASFVLLAIADGFGARVTLFERHAHVSSTASSRGTRSSSSSSSSRGSVSCVRAAGGVEGDSRIDADPDALEEWFSGVGGAIGPVTLEGELSHGIIMCRKLTR